MSFCNKPDDWKAQYLCRWSGSSAVKCPNGCGERCRFQRDKINGLGATCARWEAGDEARKIKQAEA
jgi:hypothetical protein